MRKSSAFLSRAALMVLVAAAPVFAQSKVLTGQAAFTDYTREQPGVRRHLTVADLPEPYASKGVDNGPDMVERPDNAWPQAPAGFKVDMYYTGLD
ncbi:MAG: sorbosone dehydrogenase family protein, partial [Acidobacteriaceae bacterium]